MESTSATVISARTPLIKLELPVYQGITMADVRLINSAALYSEALDTLMAAGVVGFDTESKPTFLKGEASTGPHLVQLATEERVYLFQISQLPGTGELKAILESSQLLKVGFGLGHDRSVLKSKLGIDATHVLDLGEVLRGKAHRGTVGAKVAVAHFFGQRLQKSKSVTTSNWAAPRLNERQMLYAANDAQVALRVYRAWVRTGSVALGGDRSD